FRGRGVLVVRLQAGVLRGVVGAAVGWWVAWPGGPHAATYENPHALAEGIVHALVAGVFAIENGEATGALAGQVLTPHWMGGE
ncbi:MAG: hypothetical protein OYL41_12410, partial [Acidobacteriota bacterium]|nr:hypothetical protein [Acidobacteriota bacterium]